MRYFAPDETPQTSHLAQASGHVARETQTAAKRALWHFTSMSLPIRGSIGWPLRYHAMTKRVIACQDGPATSLCRSSNMTLQQIGLLEYTQKAPWPNG